MRDETYKTMFLLRAIEMHNSQVNQAICEQRAFTMLLISANGKRYGVRYGIPNFPNTGGFWIP